MLIFVLFLKAFLEAGADIIETNTFSGTSIAQSDYGLEKVVSIYIPTLLGNPGRSLNLKNKIPGLEWCNLSDQNLDFFPTTQPE